MRIAFLEDDETFARNVTEWQSQHEVVWFSDPRVFIRDLANNQYDLYLLDYNLPYMSGLDVMQNLKLKSAMPPVIFITARDFDEDIIKVLSMGADDFIVKPVSMEVLFSRINALIRRLKLLNSVEKQATFGNLTIDSINRQFTINGKSIELTNKEADLALYFFSHMGTLVSRAHLIQVIWSLTPEVDTRTIDVHISRIRKKLELFAENGWRLGSIYNQGYRLERVE